MTFDPPPIEDRFKQLKNNQSPLGKLHWAALVARASVSRESNVFLVLQLVVEAIQIANYFDLAERSDAEDRSEGDLLQCVARARQALFGHGRVDKQGRYCISPKDVGRIILSLVTHYRRQVQGGELSLRQAIEYVNVDLLGMLGENVSDASLQQALTGTVPSECAAITDEIGLQVDFDRLRRP